MSFVPVTFLVLAIPTITAALAIEWKMKRTGGAFVAAMRNPTTALPNELKRIVADFVYYDWLNLLDVFLETNESDKFRNHVKECACNNMFVPVNRSEWLWDPIDVDGAGNIIRIDLYNQQFTDSVIGDLSKLPSTLKYLTLYDNNLTKLDVSSLPRGLNYLYLSRNKLTALELDNLPTSLLHLGIDGNNLTSVNLGHLPPRLDQLWMELNHLTEADLSCVPRSLINVDLRGNYLNNADFNSLPDDGRTTVVYGREAQFQPKRANFARYKHVILF